MWLQTAKNSAIVLLGIIVSRGFIFLYRILVIRELSVAEYAVFALLTTVLTWLLVFSHFDLYAGVSKFVSEQRAKKRLEEAWPYYSHAILIVLALSVVGLLLGLILSSSQSVSILVLIMFFIGLMPFSITTVTDGLLKACEKFKWSSMLSSSTGLTRFIFLALFLLILDEVSLSSVLVLFSVALLVPMSLSLFLIPRLDVYRHKSKMKVHMPIIKQLFHYSKWINVTDLLNSGAILVCTFFLSFFSYEDLARFNVILVFYGVFQMCMGAITTVVIPQVSKRVAIKGDINMLGKKEFLLVSIFTLIMMAIIFMLPQKELFISAILGDRAYDNVLSYVVILMILFPFKVLSVSNKGLVQGLSDTKSIASVASITFILNAILFIPMYKFFGLTGAVGTIVAVGVVECILTYNVAEKVMARTNGNFVTQE